MRVLFVNHTSHIGGAERSLIDLLQSLPPGLEKTVACPSGALADAVASTTTRVIPLNGTDASLRLDPRYTAKGVLDILRMGISLRRIAGQEKADLIHANSVRAGLAGALARRLGGPSLVVHVRDCLPDTGPANMARRVLKGSAAVLIANSAHTAKSFSPEAAGICIRAIHNPVDTDRFQPRPERRHDIRARLRIQEKDFVMAVIAQITSWKRQEDAIRCLARVRDSFPSAKLLLVGDAKFTTNATRLNNRAYLRFLHGLGDELGLNGSVGFLGERDDVNDLLVAVDLLLVPSSEEPFGRSIIEAMAAGVAVVATNRGGPAEIITDGVDGMLLPPLDPEQWAGAVGTLIRDPARRTEMGRQGRSKVLRSFTRDRHAQQVLAVYDSVLNNHSASKLAAV